jgi:ribosome maturation factor RimP
VIPSAGCRQYTGGTRRSGSGDPLFLWDHTDFRRVAAAETATAIEQQVEELLARELPEVDLRAVGVGGRPGAGVLQVVIDHPVRVDHELCVRVTRLLDDVGLRDRYSVEVSSPGPEPPLRVTSHYLAAVGGTVKLAVEPGSIPGAAKSVSGTLTEVTEGSLTVDTPAGVVVVPRDAVRRARMVKKAQCGE